MTSKMRSKYRLVIAVGVVVLWAGIILLFLAERGFLGLNVNLNANPFFIIGIAMTLMGVIFAVIGNLRLSSAKK